MTHVNLKKKTQLSAVQNQTEKAKNKGKKKKKRKEKESEMREARAAVGVVGQAAVFGEQGFVVDIGGKRGILIVVEGILGKIVARVLIWD